MQNNIQQKHQENACRSPVAETGVLAAAEEEIALLAHVADALTCPEELRDDANAGTERPNTSVPLGGSVSPSCRITGATASCYVCVRCVIYS